MPEKKKTFMEVMGEVWNLIAVSVLWIVCSIPLITIGTSTSALYYAVVKSIRKGFGYPVREFLSYFKKNWKQGIGVSIGYDLLGILVVLQGVGSISYVLWKNLIAHVSGCIHLVCFFVDCAYHLFIPCFFKVCFRNG